MWRRAGEVAPGGNAARVAGLALCVLVFVVVVLVLIGLA